MLQLEMRIVEQLPKGGVKPVIGKGAIELDLKDLQTMSPILVSECHMALDGLIAESVTLSKNQELSNGEKSTLDDLKEFTKYVLASKSNILVTRWEDELKTYIRLEMKKDEHSPSS